MDSWSCKVGASAQGMDTASARTDGRGRMMPAVEPQHSRVVGLNTVHEHMGLSSHHFGITVTDIITYKHRRNNSCSFSRRLETPYPQAIARAMDLPVPTLLEGGHIDGKITSGRCRGDRPRANAHCWRSLRALAPEPQGAHGGAAACGHAACSHLHTAWPQGQGRSHRSPRCRRMRGTARSRSHARALRAGHQWSPGQARERPLPCAPARPWRQTSRRRVAVRAPWHSPCRRRPGR
mmetsp:Transcript_20600/g.55557  ORF Transcript_20600/g.55557 Transcript_20600/m.55557 type:complete len:236 (-) Transcript_20600:78-785(-)